MGDEALETELLRNGGADPIGPLPGLMASDADTFLLVDGLLASRGRDGGPDRSLRLGDLEAGRQNRGVAAGRGGGDESGQGAPQGGNNGMSLGGPTARAIDIGGRRSPPSKAAEVGAGPTLPASPLVSGDDVWAELSATPNPPQSLHDLGAAAIEDDPGVRLSLHRDHPVFARHVEGLENAHRTLVRVNELRDAEESARERQRSQIESLVMLRDEMAADSRFEAAAALDETIAAKASVRKGGGEGGWGRSERKWGLL